MPLPDFSDIVELYVEKQMTCKQIADLKGCARDTIGRKLRTLGIAIRHHIDWSNLKEMYVNQHLSTHEIAEAKGTQRRLVRERLARMGIIRRTRSEGQLLSWSEGRRKQRVVQKGEQHVSWKGGRFVDSQGYVMVYMPNHPFAIHGRYIAEHRLVVEKRIGRYLFPWEIVHHRDGIRSHNADENLELLNSQVEHMSSILLKATQKRLVELAALKSAHRALKKEHKALKKLVQGKFINGECFRCGVKGEIQQAV